jgi:molybdenum cofactor guanylyltransferase
LHPILLVTDEPRLYGAVKPEMGLPIHHERGKHRSRRTKGRPSVTTEVSAVVGVILAGGLARRMGGGDKPLREIGGRSILARVIGRLGPQSERLLLNANDDPQRFASFGLPVVADGVKNYPGPLAGILAALDWAAANRPFAQWIVSAPGDCPFLPLDLVARLREALCFQGAELAVAASRGRSHPVIGLWSVALREALRQALVVEGVRKVDGWTKRYQVATVAWPAEPFDPFFNVNTIDDLAEAERLVAIEGMV